MFLYIAEKLYGEEGINNLYFFWRAITANEQTAIDEFLLELVSGLGEYIDPNMPKTKLTEGEMKLLY